MKVFLYTFESCKHCKDIKNLLKIAKISYTEKDVDVFADEWDNIIKEQKNEFLPTILIQNDKKKIYLMPDRDFKNIQEAVIKLASFLK